MAETCPHYVMSKSLRGVSLTSVVLLLAGLGCASPKAHPPPTRAAQPVAAAPDEASPPEQREPARTAVDPEDAKRREQSRQLVGEGGLELQAGRRAEALAAFDRAIELDPKNAEAYGWRGETKGRLGDLDAAIEDFDRSIELQPDFAGSYFGRGAARLHLGRHEAALADYDRALELDPYLFYAFIGRGRTKALLGRYAEAIEDYDRAIEGGVLPADAEQLRRLRAEASAKLKK